MDVKTGNGAEAVRRRCTAHDTLAVNDGDDNEQMLG